MPDSILHDGDLEARLHRMAANAATIEHLLGRCGPSLAFENTVAHVVAAGVIRGLVASVLEQIQDLLAGHPDVEARLDATTRQTLARLERQAALPVRHDTAHPAVHSEALVASLQKAIGQLCHAVESPPAVKNGGAARGGKSVERRTRPGRFGHKRRALLKHLY